MSDQTNDASKDFKVFVIFHGLWAFECRKEGILAHTVFSEDHNVRAGFSKNHDGSTEPATFPLAPGQATLSGVKFGTLNKMDPARNVLTKAGAFQPKKADQRFMVIDLGKPQAIHSVRTVDVLDDPKTPFAGEDGEDLHPTAVSMVQVFVYTTRKPDEVKLSTSEAKPDIDPEARVVKLHVHAESEGPVFRFHAMESYIRLAELFDLKIVPIAPLFIQPSDPGIEGLTADDMRSLAENKQGRSIAVGAKGSNCDALVLDHTDMDA